MKTVISHGDDFDVWNSRFIGETFVDLNKAEEEAMEDEKGALVQKLIDIVNEISTISDYRCTVKKQYCNLARRLKLLTPMFEEIRDCKEPVPEESFKALESLKEALESARDLLRIGSE
ncbi:unnamed protein product [Camellia sinensis]